MMHPRPHRRRLTLVLGRRPARRHLAWTRSVELMLFVTALAAVGLVLTHADGVSQAAREESHAVAHGAPLPRLHEVVADLLARSEAHEGPAPPTTPAR